MIGLDTGFFFELWERSGNALGMWRDITERDAPAAVSTVSLFELSRHGLKGHLDPSFTESVVEQTDVAYEQAVVDPVNVVDRAARITHGMGLPMADAMIAASLETVGCDRLYTGDSDFEQYEGAMDVAFL